MFDRTRLRRVETQLNMLKMQQQSHRDQPMLPHLMPQQHQLTRPFMQSNDLSHQSPSNELGSPFHSRNAQHVPGVETPQRLASLNACSFEEIRCYNFRK